MAKPFTLPHGFWVGVIGIPVLVVVLVILSIRRQKDGHTYQASCDGRSSKKTCEDYFHDYRGEASCTAPVSLTHTPCDRANVIGGCREHGMITWFYAGSTEAQATSKKCDFDHQWVPADWKEQESP